MTDVADAIVVPQIRAYLLVEPAKLSTRQLTGYLIMEPDPDQQRANAVQFKHLSAYLLVSWTREEVQQMVKYLMMTPVRLMLNQVMLSRNPTPLPWEQGIGQYQYELSGAPRKTDTHT